MNKRDYKYMIMTAGLTAAWIILLFFCVYRPLTASIAELNGQIQQDSGELAEINNFALIHNNDLTAYEKQLDINLAVLEQKIPSGAATDEALQQISRAAQTANVVITSLKIQPEKKQADISSQDIDVSLKGDYFSLLSFLRSVNLFSRTVIVEQGTMNAENDTLTCNLTLQIYTDNYNK